MKISDYINALPDAYKKNPESNNYKLLLLEQRLTEKLYEDIRAVWESGDMYSATGETLDLYGEMYGISRGKATDEQFRYLIAQKVAQNMVEGDYNSVINALAVAFKVPVTSFSIRETENPAEVEVLDLPFAVLQNAGLTVDQMTAVIQGLLPTGVVLASLELAGTFEFGAADEYDENAGFGNIAQTIGGYFGYLAS